MREKGWLGWGWILLLVSAASNGQGTVRKVEAATGSVTGEVTCSDTNAPARFAVVTLERVPEEKANPGGKSSDESGVNATAKTDLEGRFELDKVPAGRYYVLGTFSGYLNPLAQFDQDELRAMTEETQKALAKAVPIVDVEAGQAATVTLRLEHSAEVSGMVLYDDGSPAVGLHMQLLRKDVDGKLSGVHADLFEGFGLFGSNANTTDDRGHYRMIGTPPGEYAVRASLPTETVSVGPLLGGGGGMSINARSEEGGELSIYSGDVFRKKDAKTVKVGEGEQVGGLDITIPIVGLHTVRGTVTAKRDGHALNRGKVDLLYADDQESARYAQVEEDGNFVFSYLPEDKYILRLVSGADGETVEVHPYPDMTVKQEKVVRNYGVTEMPLMVQGDVSGLDLAAPDGAVERVAQE